MIFSFEYGPRPDQTRARPRPGLIHSTASVRPGALKFGIRDFKNKAGNLVTERPGSIQITNRKGQQ